MGLTLRRAPSDRRFVSASALLMPTDQVLRRAAAGHLTTDAHRSRAGGGSPYRSKDRQVVSREDLAALHSALTAVLGWPDAIREQIMKWLSSDAAWSGNGLDHDPPPHVPPTPRQVSWQK